MRNSDKQFKSVANLAKDRHVYWDQISYLDNFNFVQAKPGFDLRKATSMTYLPYQEKKLMELTTRNRNPGKAVVRPIAFKPVVQSKVSPVHTSLSPDSTYEKPHTDDGYASQDSRSCSHNGTMRDSCENRPDSYENPPFRDAKPNDFYQITPSPSDCNAGDLELLLREKEREINILRKTMEVNEKVILQVSEDKRINWENQMKELAAEYHRRIRFQQERSSKAEQDFKDHISALQKDNQRLLNENQQLLLQRDRNALIQEQLKFTKQKTDELTNKLLESNRDREVLLQQLKESQAKISYFEEQITVVKAENMNLSNELDEARRMMKKQDKCESVTPVNDRDVNRLEILLVERDAQLASERQKFIAEKESWEQEKKLVLQYQKQLQSNYMQMCRRNSELESNISVARSPTTNNNNHLAKSYDKTSFKAQLDSKPESLC